MGLWVARSFSSFVFLFSVVVFFLVFFLVVLVGRTPGMR
jgi:hypothetical protein